MHASGPEEMFRFAARVVADPARPVAQWRALTGGKAVGCIPPIPVPEILHAAGLLPVSCRVPDIPRALRSRLDAWVIDRDGPALQGPPDGRPRFEFPTAHPGDLVAALDLLESLAEWAGVVSGRPVTEGNLWNSVRAFRERDDLLFLLVKEHGGRATGFPAGGERFDLARAGDVLPPEAHSVLLARVLRGSPPEIFPIRGEVRGDPLIRLARRLIAGGEDETPFPTPEREMARNEKKRTRKPAGEGKKD